MNPWDVSQGFSFYKNHILSINDLTVLFDNYSINVVNPIGK